MDTDGEDMNGQHFYVFWARRRTMVPEAGSHEFPTKTLSRHAISEQYLTEKCGNRFRPKPDKSADREYCFHEISEIPRN